MNDTELVVCITGAAGHIATAFYVLLGSGQVFGNRVTIKLKLLELPERLNEVIGIKMQIEDCAFSLITSIEVTDDPAIAFKDIDVGIFLGGSPRKPGMERADLLQINNKIFKQQGILLNLYAKATAKILVVANPSNTNCLTMAENCPKLPRKNFTSLMQLDLNRSTAMIAQKANVSVDVVKRVIVWGNHSLTQFPDISHATIGGVPVKDVVLDHSFLQNEYISLAQRRGNKILQIAKFTSFLSAAVAVKDHLRLWHSGTTEGLWTSMGVLSDGQQYGIPEGFCFSMPVICKNFDYEVVGGLELDDFVKNKIELSLIELQNEKEEAQLEN